MKEYNIINYYHLKRDTLFITFFLYFRLSKSVHKIEYNNDLYVLLTNTDEDG
jgi:hypothetical protein